MTDTEKKPWGLLEVDPKQTLESLGKREYIFRPFRMQRGWVVGFIGASNSSKTKLMSHIALLLSNNVDTFLGRKIGNDREQKVLLVDLEQGLKMTQRVMIRMASGLSISKSAKLIDRIDMLDSAFDNNFDSKKRIIDSPQYEKLVAFVEEKNYDIIFIDSQRETYNGSENESEIVSPVMERFRRLAHRTGATVVIIHHCGKNATTKTSPQELYDSLEACSIHSARGSSAFVAGLDQQIEIAKLSQKDLQFAVSLSKMRDGRPWDTIRYKLVDEGDEDEDGDCPILKLEADNSVLRGPNKGKSPQKTHGEIDYS